MTKKQMFRAMRRYGISLVYVEKWDQWFAGKGEAQDQRGELRVDYRNLAGLGQYHFSKMMEEAVEDFCNARDLEWDV